MGDIQVTIRGEARLDRRHAGPAKLVVHVREARSDDPDLPLAHDAAVAVEVRGLPGLETLAAHAVGVQVVTKLRHPPRPTRLDSVAPPGHDGLEPVERDASADHPDDPGFG